MSADLSALGKVFKQTFSFQLYVTPKVILKSVMHQMLRERTLAFCIHESILFIYAIYERLKLVIKKSKLVL